MNEFNHDAVFGKKTTVYPDQFKAQRDREYRDKRLLVAAVLWAAPNGMRSDRCLRSADILIRANEEMAVPE